MTTTLTLAHQHFTGALTARDAKRHLPHRFVAPAGGGELRVEFQFTPAAFQGMENMLTLTIFDPTGFRGARHRGGSRHTVQITHAAATPGYLPGSLPAGDWIVEIDTHRIVPGTTLHYTLDVTVSAAAENALPAAVRGAELAGAASVRKRGPGWYRGDLHSHTDHSDAGERTSADLIAAARGARLDFLFLTDHNTTAGLPFMDRVAVPDLLTAGGLELTTFWGHALCLGARRWIDWRVGADGEKMAQIAAAAYALDQVYIIAHPMSPGDPGCTGCAWRYGAMMPGNARLVEIWNGPWAGDSNNEQALALWYDWLNQGRRLVATAGSDTHGDQDYAANPGFSVIYAAELSERALLDGLRAGHLYLSTGPQVSFVAQGDHGASWQMGDTVTEPVTLALGWSECPPGARCRLMANGMSLAEWDAAGAGASTWRLAPEAANWVLLEIRAAQGEMLAITNPIFLERPAG